MLTLTVISILHYLYDWHNDKIRIRLLYGFLIWVDLAAFAAIALQPHLYDMLMRVAIICTAPLIGHFLALTTTKFCNIVSIVIMTVAVALTIYCIWTP